MIQRQRLLLVTLFALYCGNAFALGLGELDLKSALNQRFDAEIALSNTGGLELIEIIPKLATDEDFEQVGVNRDYHLTDLRFNAQLSEDGTHIVHISSGKPIIEPFLNFIVEVLWPNGRILREYVVLLDPPVFSSEGIEKIELSRTTGSVSVGNTSSGNAFSGSNTPEQSGSRSGGGLEIPPASSGGNRRTQGGVAEGEEYGVTRRGDTLWSIASMVRPNERISVKQTMLALQRANPEAFISNNINLLKAGYVLRIPGESEIRAETSEEADVAVLSQNQEFEDYRTRDVTQIDARRAASSSAAGSDDSDDGELKLLAADQSGAQSGRDDTRADELENSLAVAREELDRSQRANSEINARLSYIDGQVETLSELVNLKDDQLAALRAELARQAAETITQPVEPAVIRQQANRSFFSSPLVLGVIGLLLIGLVAGALMMLRKRRQEDQLDDNEFPETMIEEDHPQVSSIDLRDEATDGVIEDGAAEESDALNEDFTQQTSDVIGEAEIYISYGRFPQAISLLQKAIENEPHRTDIQLRLLEVYVQTEDAAAFNLQYEQLKLLSDDDAISEGAELQVEMLAGADTSDLDLDLDVDLDVDLDLDLDLDPNEDVAGVSSEPIVTLEDSGVDDDDLSFDLELEDLEDADDIGHLKAETDDVDPGLTDTVRTDIGLTDIGEVLSPEEVREFGDANFDHDLDELLEEGIVSSTEEEADLDLALGLDNETGLEFDDDDIDVEEDLLDLDLDDDDLLELDENETLEFDDDDTFELDDDAPLELDDDDTLDLDEDEPPELDDDETLELDDGDILDLDDDETLDLDDAPLEFGDDDSPELVDDDAIDLDLDDDDEFDLGFDDDVDEPGLEEDPASKLDLARAYIEMGDNGGAKPLLEAVLSQGDEAQIDEANELLGNIR